MTQTARVIPARNKPVPIPAKIQPTKGGGSSPRLVRKRARGEDHGQPERDVKEGEAGEKRGQADDDVVEDREQAQMLRVV